MSPLWGCLNDSLSSHTRRQHHSKPLLYGSEGALRVVASASVSGVGRLWLMVCRLGYNRMETEHMPHTHVKRVCAPFQRAHSVLWATERTLQLSPGMNCCRCVHQAVSSVESGLYGKGYLAN